MNLLQTFVGRVYPGSIRNETLEQCDPGYNLKVTNVDESDNPISHGELQVTDIDLIYLKPSKAPTRWPLDCIRRYGSNGEKFVIEVGRRCSTGQAIYAFRLDNAQELVERLKSKISKLSSSTSSPRSSNGGQFNSKTNRKQDASTSTEDQNEQDTDDREQAGLRPLSYALIDFETTKALTATAQAHAASRDFK